MSIEVFSPHQSQPGDLEAGTQPAQTGDFQEWPRLSPKLS
jgi:hypothetical protein